MAVGEALMLRTIRGGERKGVGRILLMNFGDEPVATALQSGGILDRRFIASFSNAEKTQLARSQSWRLHCDRGPRQQMRQSCLLRKTYAVASI
jgi:hypothetical protein